MAIYPTLVDEDLYGRQSLSNTGRSGTMAKRRRASAHRNFYHVARNGVADPFTFFHLLDLLLTLPPETPFHVADLMPVLRAEVPGIIWDPTTVGRVLVEMAEALEEANGRASIDRSRTAGGMVYSVRSDPESRTALHNLLDDLYRLGSEVVGEEAKGYVRDRQRSPVLDCPSVMEL